MSQARRCEVLTLDARLTSYGRCGRHGSPSIADGTGYRVACPQHAAEVARVRAAGLGRPGPVAQGRPGGGGALS